MARTILLIVLAIGFALCVFGCFNTRKYGLFVVQAQCPAREHANVQPLPGNHTRLP